MYQLKNAVRRAVALTTAVGMAAGITSTALPALVYADAYNPLTERSLVLSSSSPGWAFTDGSGNSTYAGPGTGPNGKQTGETFSFRVSTDSTTSPTIKGFTLQYCTAPAGKCFLPGNFGATETPVDLPEEQESNLDVHYTDSTDAGATAAVQGTDYQIYIAPNATDGDFSNAVATTATDWEMIATREVHADNPTGTTEKNFITLYSPTGINPAAGTKIWIVFKASDDNYITNPGSGAFFVKINDYDTDDPDEMYAEDHVLSDYEDHIIDGGVTVANVMNESIWITTKVLETMAFSVGTENPDTLTIDLPSKHGACDPITKNDRIQLGDQNAEFSLSPSHAYDAYSYWRLATNSSGGAVVYYSGQTLENTVGDDIDPMDDGTVAEVATAAPSHPGTEQFGLALDSTADTYTDMISEGLTPSVLSPLTAVAPYNSGAGTTNNSDYTTNTALFAFTNKSMETPEQIANYFADVIECSTGKMRYIANIAPATPAGVYTTKINYIAAPQY